jgi:hypothetical protein
MQEEFRNVTPESVRSLDQRTHHEIGISLHCGAVCKTGILVAMWGLLELIQIWPSNNYQYPLATAHSLHTFSHQRHSS